MKSTVIITSKAGRLGNRLFLSAYFMANALTHGYVIMNPALGEYARYFEGSARDPLCRFPIEIPGLDPDLAEQCRDVVTALLPSVPRILPLGRILDIRATHDASDLVYDLNGNDYGGLLREGGLLFVKGWKYRDHEHLVARHHEIREYFSPVEQVRTIGEHAVGIARTKGDFLIGVHIRQGDYRDWKGGAHYFETDRYVRWMMEAAVQHPDKRVSFLVCASEPLDLGLFRNLPVTAGPGEAVTDLHALSLCDAIMGPPSTFSTWASYIGRRPLCMLQNQHQVLCEKDFLLHDRV